MNHKAFDAIVKLDLIHQGDRVCAALSGGADSVALTHFLWKNREQLGITLTACHLNHCLREEESFRDQRFVEDFCRERSIPLTLRTVDIAALARKTASRWKNAAGRNGTGCLKSSAPGNTLW